MRRVVMWFVVLGSWAGSLSAQASSDPVEVPLRLEDGRLLVTAQAPDGKRYDFVLGLGETMVTEAGAQRLGASVGALTLGGIPVNVEQLATVPASALGLEGKSAVGVIGGHTLNKFDALIDVPNGRLVLKPVGRVVRWDGVQLSNPTSIQILHDVLIRVNIEAGGVVMTGLLDLSGPTMEANEPLRPATTHDGSVLTSFRMGYGRWSDLPVEISDAPIFRRWVKEGDGFIVIGAPVAYDCAIAISWFHSEMRTCTP